MNRQGFSLIETVLALGIVALLLTSVLGLLPAGLDTARAAERRAVEALILSNVRARCRVALPLETISFSSDGTVLADATQLAAFTVRVTPGPSLALPGDEAPTIRTATIELRDHTRTWRRMQPLVLPYEN